MTGDRRPSVARGMWYLVAAHGWSWIERLALAAAEACWTVHARAGGRADDAGVSLAVEAGTHPGSARLRASRAREAMDVTAVRILTCAMEIERYRQQLDRETRLLRSEDCGDGEA